MNNSNSNNHSETELLNTVSYEKIIAETDIYRTPNRGKTRFPSLLFYSRLAKIIFKSGRQARNKKYGPAEWVKSSLDIIAALESVGIGIEVTGIENIKKARGNVMFIGNHMSTLETLVLPAIIQPVKNVTVVAKEELLKYPYFSDILLSRDPIVVGRSNARDDLMTVMKKGSQYLKSDLSIIIFPQKTRSSYFDADTFNSLGVKLAKRNNVQIISVALVTDAWGNGKIIKDIGKITPDKKVRFCFSEPFYVESDKGGFEHKKVLDFITQKFIQWKRTDCLLK